VLAPLPEGFDPASMPLTVDITLSPETEDGVVLSLGGQSHGFALHLDGGVPCFAIRSSGALGTVRADAKLPLGQRARVVGALTGQPRLRIYVDGRLAGEAEPPGFVHARPNEGLTLGADTDTQVADHGPAAGFTGVLGPVAIHRGDLDPAALAK